MMYAAELRSHYDIVRGRLGAPDRLPTPRVKLLQLQKPRARFVPKRSIDEGLGVVANSEQIITEVAAKYGLNIWDIKGRCRQVPHILARREAVYRLRHEITIAGLSLSWERIGLALGGRDHSSTINNYNNYVAAAAEKAG